MICMIFSETLNEFMIAFDGDLVTPPDSSPNFEFVSPVSHHISLDYELGLSKGVKECFIESKEGTFAL